MVCDAVDDVEDAVDDGNIPATASPVKTPSKNTRKRRTGNQLNPVVAIKSIIIVIIIVIIIIIIIIIMIIVGDDEDTVDDGGGIPADVDYTQQGNEYDDNK